MKIYELCVVAKEYRYMKVKAESEQDAIDLAWDKVASGFIPDTKAQDYDTEIYLEGVEE
jgi:hypothetical protein